MHIYICCWIYIYIYNVLQQISILTDTWTNGPANVVTNVADRSAVWAPWSLETRPMLRLSKHPWWMNATHDYNDEWWLQWRFGHCHYLWVVNDTTQWPTILKAERYGHPIPFQPVIIILILLKGKTTHENCNGDITLGKRLRNSPTSGPQNHGISRSWGNPPTWTTLLD